MLDTVMVSRAIGLAGLLPGVLLVGLVGTAVVARLRGRSVGRVWQRLFAASIGGDVGAALLVPGNARLVRGSLLLAALFVGLWLVWLGRRTAVGWFALAVALPRTLLWGYFVALLLAGADFEPYSAVAT